MASPQKENGFSPIANEILENVYSRKFNLNEMKVILILWRYTYGFQRKEHDLSLGYISAGTGVDRKAVKRSLDNLIKNNVIIITKQATFNESRKISFNKDYDSWNVEKNTKEPQGTKEHTGGRFDHTTGGRFDHQERNNKESSSSSSEDVFQFFLNNVQRRGFSISPFVAEVITQLENEYGQELLLAAMKITAYKNKDDIGYTEGILKKWKLAGVANIEQARTHEKQFKESMNQKYNKPKQQNAVKYNELTEGDILND